MQAGRRLPALLEDKRVLVTHLVDSDFKRAASLAKQCGAKPGVDWRKAVNDPVVDIVLVLTYPDSHADITIAALEAGADVLCEKPLARTIKEAKAMVKVAGQTRRILQGGFNHRHHPAIFEAHKQFNKGVIGEAVFGRGRYGIAGREGLEKEWRSDPNVVSGGQLMEQGIHLVDLFCWFLSDITHVSGMVSTTHWPIAPLEDNGLALLKTKSGVLVSLHSSLTQWINLFHFELYGSKGSISVEGLGGSYGVEKLIISKYDPQGAFSYQTTEYRSGDKSWQAEWNEFMNAVRTRRQPLGNGEDGLKAMSVVEAIYKAARTSREIAIT